MVGANGFEPSTSWSRTRRASQAALRPEQDAQTMKSEQRYSLTQANRFLELRSAPVRTAGSVKSGRRTAN